MDQLRHFTRRGLLLILLASGLNLPQARGQEKSKEQERAIAEIEKLGGTVYRDKTKPEMPVVDVSLIGHHVTDAELTHLNGLTKLEYLTLGFTHATDAGLAHLEGLADLQFLNLKGTRVTDAGLAHLKGLTKLRVFHLSDTRVTDARLAHLKGLTKLRVLKLDGTRVTDSGLAHLKELTQLEYLTLAGTLVTDAGVKTLQQAMPKVEVDRLLEEIKDGSR